MEIKSVGVVGAGQMGNGIAHVMALAGYEVRINDVRQDALDQAMNVIGKNLDRQVQETKKITDNQALIIEITRDGNALREREAAALERIAEALEKRS